MISELMTALSSRKRQREQSFDEVARAIARGDAVTAEVAERALIAADRTPEELAEAVRIHERRISLVATIEAMPAAQRAIDAARKKISEANEVFEKARAANVAVCEPLEMKIVQANAQIQAGTQARDELIRTATGVVRSDYQRIQGQLQAARETASRLIMDAAREPEIADREEQARHSRDTQNGNDLIHEERARALRRVVESAKAGLPAATAEVERLEVEERKIIELMLVP